MMPGGCDRSPSPVDFFDPSPAPDLSKDSGLGFLDELQTIADEDAAGLIRAQESYGCSWKIRGGVGAFMMLARKWDRIEKRMMERSGLSKQEIEDIVLALDCIETETEFPPELEPVRVAELMRRLMKSKTHDIFAHIAADTRAEGIIDDIRDLRRYLMLVEAEMRARGFRAEHRDNKNDGSGPSDPPVRA